MRATIPARVSMYLCIYVSMYLCICVTMHLCMYLSIYLSIYIYIYLHVYIHAYMYINILCRRRAVALSDGVFHSVYSYSLAAFLPFSFFFFLSLTALLL